VPKCPGRLIAICELAAARIASMNNLAAHQIPLCRF
jgi:hypothetical protein